MKTTIAIDTERVIEHVYAFCAIDFFTDKSPKPEVLGRDNKDALLCMTLHCASDLVYRLSPYVCGTSLTETDADNIITIDLDLPEDYRGPSLRPLLETALAALVMATAYSGNKASLSATYFSMYERNMRTASTAMRSADRPGFIRPAC